MITNKEEGDNSVQSFGVRTTIWGSTSQLDTQY